MASFLQGQKPLSERVYNLMDMQTVCFFTPLNFFKTPRIESWLKLQYKKSPTTTCHDTYKVSLYFVLLKRLKELLFTATNIVQQNLLAQTLPRIST